MKHFHELNFTLRQRYILQCCRGNGPNDVFSCDFFPLGLFTVVNPRGGNIPACPGAGDTLPVIVGLVYMRMNKREHK